MKKRIAVIDTETTYYDDVMSIGIVIADSTNLTADMSLYQVAYATASVTLRLNLSVFTKRLYF